MNDALTLGSNASIDAIYRDRTPGSREMFERAQGLFPSGVTHDLRHQNPYPIYMSHGEGARKWDVDDNAYVDYLGGHGALLLGHSAPAVVEAVQAQMARGTHLGASHELEVRWAELVQRLVPSAARVRFTASGTEATLLALRLARAHTGRNKIIRFEGHFHGWHDYAVTGYVGHYDGSPAPGIQSEVAASSLVVAPNDEAAVRDILQSNPDIAAVILEPTGGHFGKTLIAPGFLSFLREACTAHDVALIFDEVVTGFRVSPGGAQGHYGVTPDLTTLGKVLAGGLPGGAVAGSEEILAQLDFAAAESNGVEKIGHAGTFNANPLSAAAGVTALAMVAEGEVCDRANDTAAELRDALNGVLAEADEPWAVYGEFSSFHLFTNPDRESVSPEKFDPASVDHQALQASNPEIMRLLRLGMLVSGVDINSRFSGWTSAVHGGDEVLETVNAFRETVGRLKSEFGRLD